MFRTYFINNRGDEVMGGTWAYLDMTALGRQEEWEDSPEGYPQTPPYVWWNWHDEYDASRHRQVVSDVDRRLTEGRDGVLRASPRPHARAASWHGHVTPNSRGTRSTVSPYGSVARVEGVERMKTRTKLLAGPGDRQSPPLPRLR